MPTEIQDALAHGKSNQARIILSIDDLGKQISVFKDLLANNLSVRELKIRLENNENQQLEENNNQQSLEKIDPEIYHYQEQLAEILGAPVKIENTEKKGKLSFLYSPEEIRDYG